MNILFFIHSLSNGGAERVTATLANFWVEKGWSITLVTVADIKDDFYNLDSRIERVSLGMAQNSRTPVHAVINNLRRIRELRQVLIGRRPDVAVAMMATANVTLALAARSTGVPVVGSERTYPPAMPLGLFWEWMRRKAYPWLDYLVAQTNESASWLELNAAPKHLAVIPNPLSYPLLPQDPIVNPGEIMSQLGRRKLLLAVGRLGTEKGFDRLLSAFGLLAERFPDWGLIILGTGSLQEQLVQQISDLGLEGQVAMPGAVGNVGDWYELADIYVLASRFEGFPNTLVEALAYGVPSIAVDCKTGPREILRDGVDGFLVSQDDNEALASAIEKLMRDGTRRALFAAKAIEIRERLAVERVASDWEEVFRKLQ